MNQDLEIPLEFFLQENSILCLTTDRNKVIGALKLSGACEFNEEKLVIRPILNTLKNHVTINHIN